MIDYYLFYIYLFVVSSIDLFFYSKRYFKVLQNKILSLTWFVLIFFIGFRYKLGNDWYSYEQIIDSVPPLFHSNVSENIFYGRNIEFGFIFLISLINEIFIESSDRLQSLIFLISFFNYSILVYVIKKLDIIKYKLLFISIYIGFAIFRDFDLLRQSISLYIFIFSILYIKNNPLKYFILNIFGSFFHVSSLLFLPIYKFLKYKTKKFYILLPLILFLSIIAINSIAKTNLLKLPLNFLPEFIGEKIDFLILNSSSNYFSTSLLLNIFISISLLLFYKKIKLNEFYVNLFINLFIVMFLINVIFLDSSEIQERFSYFFYFTISFILVMMIDIIKNYSKFMFYLFISLVLCLPSIRFHRVMSGDGNADLVFLPYRNYFFQSEYSEYLIYFNWNKKFNLK